MPGWLLPALIMASSLLPGLVIFFLRDNQVRLRTTLNLVGASTKLLLIVALIWSIGAGGQHELRLTMLPGMHIVLNADALSTLFVTLSGVLWLFTTIYAIGYLEHGNDRSRFFGYFSLCVSATTGLAMAGNLLTFLVFFELLTVVTYPLVVHRGTPEALRAGRIYLAYTLSGGAILMIGVAWLRALAGPLDFTEAGVLAGRTDLDPTALVIIFAMLIAGLGVKAALVPLHGWLPRAMVAPAPVSALLHAVAVVKAGAFGIVRVVYDVYGVELAGELGVLPPLAALAAVTIIYGSLMALRQDELKKRLAYSTISQVSYIALGVALASPMAALGGIVHLVHQGLMKITLFFCAGNIAEATGLHHISKLDGIGRKLPLTMAAFTIAALGMIGVPPVAGFFTKLYLARGAADVGATWVLPVLLASSLMNAMYFLPILGRAWFRPLPEEKPDPAHVAEHPHYDGEPPWTLLVPTLATALAALLIGLFAGYRYSPASWAQLIVDLEYGL